MKKNNNIEMAKVGMLFFAIFCVLALIVGGIMSSEMMMIEAVVSFVLLEIIMLLYLQRNRYYAEKGEDIYDQVRVEGRFILGAGASWIFIMFGQIMLEWEFKWYVIIYFTSILLGVIFESIHPSAILDEKETSGGRKAAAIGTLAGLVAIYGVRAVAEIVSQKMMQMLMTGVCLCSGIVCGIIAGRWLYRMGTNIVKKRRHKK